MCYATVRSRLLQMTGSGRHSGLTAGKLTMVTKSEIIDIQSQMAEDLAPQTDRLVQQTIDLCNLNSDSFCPPSLEQTAAAVDALFGAHFESVSHRQLPATPWLTDLGEFDSVAPAKMLIYHTRPSAPLQFLLTGHYDTVHRHDGPFQNCKISGHQLHGPGTADMKGGLVVMLEACKAINNSPLADQIGFTVAISPDEEIGSLASGPVLTSLAKDAHFGLTFEPALADGTLAGARKGSGNFALILRGKSTHAGRKFFDGRNAVIAACDASTQLSQLSDEALGITVNVSRIAGGSPENVVPDLAVVRFNARVFTTEQMNIEQRFQAIAESVASQHQLDVTLQGSFSRPPKPMTPDLRAMFDVLCECGQRLEIPIQYNATGGCCEGNNLAAAGLTNIDTLGVCGANIHSNQEYADINSFVPRTQLTAFLISSLLAKQTLR